MAKLIATINDVTVYSDKELSGIHGTRITFTDGSWCDVVTKQSVNNGPGEISFDTPGEEKKKKRISKNFDGNHVKVTGLTANVNILLHDENAIVVTVLAPPDAHDNINIHQDGQTVKVYGSGIQTNSSISISGGSINMGTIRGASVIVGNGVSIINGRVVGGNQIKIGSSEPEAIVEVKVPKGTSVTIDNVSGEVNIGDIEADVTLTADATSVIKAGKVANSILGASAGGSIAIEESRSKTILARASSGGSIRVRRGASDIVTATASSGGSVNIGASAERAVAAASSGGSVDLYEVKNEPSIKESTGGSVRIGNW